MILRRLSQSLKDQNWTAITVEFLQPEYRKIVLDGYDADA